MKARELRNLSDAELEAKLRGLQEELFNIEFRLVTQQIENPLRIRLLRRDIARALTVVRERESKVGRGGGEPTGAPPASETERAGGTSR